MKPHPWLVVVFGGALLGLALAGVSTYDFVQHLDRQVHSLHCSFIPGAGAETGESGCQVAMMSSYSSVMRSVVWGGIPISLPAMAVFAFIALFSIDLLLTRRKDDPRATGFLAVACALPAATSIVMLVISLTQLGTTCKVCVGIYAASALCLTGAIALWRRAVREGGAVATRVATPRKRGGFDDAADPAWVGASRGLERPSGSLELAVAAPATSMGFLVVWFCVGVAFVLVPVLLYLPLAPEHGRFVGTCDGLAKPDDVYGVMVRMDRSTGRDRVPAIEVLDPLCPACKAFEQRLARSGYADRLDRRAILFPLDNTCNWMVTEATHPGACTVSEAVLCAGDRAPEVIAWAFEVQDQVRDETRRDAGAAARLVKQRWPDLASCVGSPEARSRLNKSLRWSVANNVRVLTPQLYVANVKLCDEDVDLGLEYSLRMMLDKHAAGTLVNPAGGTATMPATGAGSAEAPHGDKAAGDKAAGDKAAGDTTGAGEPAGDKAVGDKPATDNAVGDKAATGEAAGDQAAGDKASADKTSSDKPSGDKPSSDSPSTDKQSTDKPATDKPATDKPATDKPATDKPATDKPPASKPAADKPAAKPATKPAPRKPPADSPTDKPVTSPSGADKPVTSPSAVDKPADKPVTSPSGADPGGAP